MEFVYIIGSTLLISLISLIGVFFIYANEQKVRNLTYMLISLSTGTLLGGAFFHILPEAIEELNVDTVMLIVVTALLIFFFLERVLNWHHCHKHDCEEKAVGYLNLTVDSIHNFVDGIVIAASFMASPILGVTSTIAIALHEIPQELGDFGVLLHAGIKKQKAIVFNLLVATTSIIGGITGYIFLDTFTQLTAYLLPFAAGGFLYIAMTDLIPEIKVQPSRTRSNMSFLLFILGLVLMYSLKSFLS